jgi:GR25 family glycosyltransferase involved in LPS biosynthesis
MINQLDRFGFSDYSFYEEFDGNELTQEIVDQHCVRKHMDWNTVAQKISLWNIGIETQRELNPAELSLTIKHGKVFQQLSEQEGDVFIIFEDDVILCNDFDKHFNEYLSRTPDDWDVIHFGSGAGLKAPNTPPDKIAYRMNHPASRCTDSILLNKSALQDLAKTWFPFHLICDYELGYQHYLHNHKIYWWEPGLVRQGSEHGIFKSVLR